MVEHGRDGWELADYDWDPETGLATLTYERLCEDTDGKPNAATERTIVTKAQPHDTKHTGWYTRF
jgi:hypothetical protein